MTRNADLLLSTHVEVFQQLRVPVAARGPALHAREGVEWSRFGGHGEVARRYADALRLVAREGDVTFGQVSDDPD